MTTYPEGLTSKNFVKKLFYATRKAAMDNPEQVYMRIMSTENPSEIPEPCCYLDTTGQVCLVGQGLRDIGFLDEHLYSFNTDGSIASVACHVLKSEFESLPDPDKIRLDWLAYAQAYQDQGSSWGEALMWADSQVKLQYSEEELEEI